MRDAELPTAKKRREHGHDYRMDEFIHDGRCRHRRHETVVQVTNHGHGKLLVSPPGKIVHLKRRRIDGALRTIVFVERPDRRCRDIRRVAKAIGPGALKRLNQDGLVKNREFLAALLNFWA